MHIATLIYTFLFGKFVGNDEFGNSYYRSRAAKSKKRWVIYKGVREASKVPPLWHRWLHYTSDLLPSEQNQEKFKWQKPHQANFTGSSKAYKPHREKAKDSYKAWKPGA